jgi:hypothetical protein
MHIDMVLFTPALLYKLYKEAKPGSSAVQQKPSNHGTVTQLAPCTGPVALAGPGLLCMSRWYQSPTLDKEAKSNCLAL